MLEGAVKFVLLFCLCVVIPMFVITMPFNVSCQPADIKAEVEEVKENKKLLKLMDSVEVSQGSKASLVRAYFEGPGNYYVDYIVVTESGGGCAILRR